MERVVGKIEKLENFERSKWPFVSQKSEIESIGVMTVTMTMTTHVTHQNGDVLVTKDIGSFGTGQHVVQVLVAANHTVVISVENWIVLFHANVMDLK